MVKDQMAMTRRLMTEAKELWPKEDAESRYEAGFRLLLVQRSTPKDQEFIDFLKTGGHYTPDHEGRERLPAREAHARAGRRAVLRHR